MNRIWDGTDEGREVDKETPARRHPTTIARQSASTLPALQPVHPVYPCSNRLLSVVIALAAVLVLAWNAPLARTAPAEKPVDAAAPTPAVDLGSLSDFAEVTLDGIVFVKIPAGRFLMGTTDAQRAALKAAGEWLPAQEDERPAHRVTITRPFLLGKFEVTQAQWTAVIAKDPPGTTRREKEAIKAPSAFKGENLPVERVSWRDVQAYLERLNRTGGGKYRLPTEAEWECAARAGGDGLYGMGAGGTAITAETLGEFGWFRSNSGSKTQPVGSRKPNAWGLHDMLGGVWEWCQDYYSPKAYSSAPATDPVSTTETSEHVYRGGSWFLEPHQLRAGFRGGNLVTSRTQYAGFRLLREL
jgi:formylglycine-generating enzyme required for sulfatase activity